MKGLWEELTPGQRRWIIQNALIVTAVINVVLNAGIAWASAGGERAVPLWSIPLVDPPSTVTDTVGTLFILPVVTALLCTRAVWRDRRAGRLPQLARRARIAAVAPAGPLRRGLALGATCAVIFGPPAIAVLAAVDLSGLSRVQFATYKSGIAVALGAVVTPVIALWAMTDAVTAGAQTDPADRAG